MLLKRFVIHREGELYQFHVVPHRFTVWNSVQRFLHFGNIFLLWLCLMWVFCSVAFIPHWEIEKKKPIILKGLV